MELTFVDNSRVMDDATRSAIRRHAARGQNLGRKITRPSRMQALQTRTRPKSAAVSRVGNAPEGEQRQNGDSDRSFLDMSSHVEPVIGDSVSVLSLPVQVAEGDRALMYEAVAFLSSPKSVPRLANALTKLNTSRSLWLRLMFTDQAYYHCALALVLECTQLLPQSRHSAIRHINQTFRLIGERISRPGQITNETVAVVMSLSAYESTRGRYKQGAVHVAGFLHMVELRGGLASIASEASEILQKLYRADLDYALQLGTSPKLDIKVFENSPDMEKLDLHITQENTSFAETGPLFREQLGAELSWLWDTVFKLSTLVNEASRDERPKLPAERAFRSYVWLGHRLLNHTPLNAPRSPNRIRSLAHLGLVILVSSTICGLDRRVRESPAISQLIRAEAELGSSHETHRLLLWVLFLGAASVLQDPAHDTWLLPKTQETMEDLGLYTWEDTRKVLSEFPWMNELYEQEGSALYYRATYCFNRQLAPS